jgi:hypothetical protein
MWVGPMALSTPLAQEVIDQVRFRAVAIWVVAEMADMGGGRAPLACPPQDRNWLGGGAKAVAGSPVRPVHQGICEGPP